MTGKGEYYVRCKNCGKLIKVFKAPSRGYCTKCGTLFDYDTQDIVFSGITTIPSDYHYEWEKETAYNLDEVINTPYIQIGGKQFKTKDFMEALKRLMEEK